MSDADALRFPCTPQATQELGLMPPWGYSGCVESISGGAAEGWVWLPRRPGYAPVIHALCGGRVIASGMPSVPSDPSRKLDGKAYLFTLDISVVSQEYLPYLTVVIGESDEELPFQLAAEQAISLRGQQRSQLTVEDLLSIRNKHSWVRGATYLDALEAGVEIDDMLDMFYLDYLGRPADESGRAHFASMIGNSQLSYEDVRRVLLGSLEFNRRKLENGTLPGAFFSNPIWYKPIAPFPGKEEASQRRRVPAGMLAPLWGENFVSAAYAEICNAPIAKEIALYFMQMIDTRKVSKLDIAREMQNISNRYSEICGLTDEGVLDLWTARRHHGIPFSLLSGIKDDDEFLEKAFFVIFGGSAAVDGMSTPATENGMWRAEIVRGLLQEAHGRGIPAVVEFDCEDAEQFFGYSAVPSLEIELDDKIKGHGWHKAEQKQGVQWRWMPETAGLILPRLARTGVPVTLTITGYSTLHVAAINSLVCRLNGIELSGQVQQENSQAWSFVSAPIPRAAIDICEPYFLEFRVTNNQFPQHPVDSRYLTVAISKIALA